jgi:UPF0755 protein
MKKIIFIAIPILTLLFFLGLYKWFDHQSFWGVASQSNIVKNFEVKEGEGSTEVGENLEKEGLVKSKYFFWYYAWKTKTDSKIQVGIYELAPNMSIGEIMEKFTKGEIIPQIVKLTIPEGFTNKKVVERLKEKKPELANDFEAIVNCKCINQPQCVCDLFSDKYDFIKQLSSGIDLEGYLFPDTYFIDKEDTAQILVAKFLGNFNRQVDSSLRQEITDQGKTLNEIVTMASIIEKEAKTEQDRKMVSGVFWNRIRDDHPLQSCATLAYILGIDKVQYSYEDTQIQSPYNTYLNSGLPPGPVANPGLAAIRAAVYPEKSDYYYFLSDPVSGTIIYSKTIEEHNSNKDKFGL